MSAFYDIDSTRVTHREYWWGSRSPLVLIGWLIKWLHVRIPSSSDDPNVDSISPFLTEALPPEIAAVFAPVATELDGLGFHDPVYHVIYDAGTRTWIYWATFAHDSGRCFARIHHRIWHQAQKAHRGLFPMFFTEFADGTFLVSSAGKPDMAAPQSVQMNRMRGASAEKLFAAHEGIAQSLSQRKMISPVRSREDLLTASERHHVLMRDFHLGRGVFRPRSAAGQASAAEFAAAVAQAEATSQEHGEVLAEVARLQDKKPSWRTAVWVFAGSLVLFLAIGAAGWDWKFTLWIIPVLLFHEGGHWVAMRLFRYRNLRMFFIPMFGAAVTGQSWNVPGWKKALVSLAGPLPGIALGIVLGFAALVLNHAWLNQAALVLLLVNGLNLLPILPLDGGHVLQQTLFCRNRWLDGAFRILAIAGMVLLGTFGGMKMLKYVAIAMALALPIVFKLGKVTDEVRRQPLPPPLPGDDRIPVPTAQAIVKALRAAFPPKATPGNKMLAQHTLTVFERLNAQPPGFLGTVALLVVHAGSFVAALVVCLLLVVGQHGGLGDFFGAAARQPRHKFEPRDTEMFRPAPPDAGAINTLVVTTLKNRNTACKTFATLTNQVSAGGSLSRLGDSLILSLPAGDDASREKWYDKFQALDPDAFVALSNAPVLASLSFIAPNERAATNLSRELKDYFSAPGQIRLVPPWAQQAKSPEFAAFAKARREWSLIQTELARTWRDPSLKSYADRIQTAIKRGSQGEMLRLEKERTEKREALQAQARERLRTEQPQRVSPGLLDLHTRFTAESLTNRAERKALLHEMGLKLGQLPDSEKDPSSCAAGCLVTSGMVIRHGLLVELHSLNFSDITHGLPSLVQWLADQGCRPFKYALTGAGWSGTLDEADEAEE